MSFVLEALKKQEASADPEAAVSLARAVTLHRRHRLWMTLAAVAMVVNAALLLWIFDPLGSWSGRERTVAAPTAAAAPTAEAAPTADAPAAASAPRTEAPTAAAAPPREPPSGSVGQWPAPDVPTPTPAASARADRPSAASAAPTVVALADLPAAARRRFPGIAFSTHIYAEDPSLRAVVANGERRQEGDRIRGLEILAITASGVVLAFEQYRVEVPMVVDWDSL